MKYFIFIALSFSIIESYSQEFSSDSCYDGNQFNARLDKATTKDSISKLELMNSTGLVSDRNKFTILSFTFALNGCDSRVCEVGSNKFSEMDKKVLRWLRPGAFIFFEKIEAKDENGKVFYMKPFWYRVY